MILKNPQLTSKLDLVSQDPGVYLMKDATGSILYVGKAIHLRQRLRSYFVDHPQVNARIASMISKIFDFSTIICDNELEALILESTLIKKHQPPYNVLLRDDRDYPYIRVTWHETYPRVLKAFRIGNDREQGARYYGPYLAGDVKAALEALRSVFPIKTCRRVLPRDIGHERPCLNYYIGRCIGPCQGSVSADDYRKVINRICQFLDGKADTLLSELQKEMDHAADHLNFEEAARIRDRIQALKRLMKDQKIVIHKPVDQDVLGLSQNGSEMALQKLEIRNGRLVGSSSFFWPETEISADEWIRAFIVQHYPDIATIPPEILVPVDLPDQPALEAFLRDRRSGRCVIRRPQRGRGVALLQMAHVNADEALRRHTLTGGNQQAAIQEALRLLSGHLGLEKPPNRIEALDISFTDQQDRAAGLVVFEQGRPKRNQYRHFRLQSIENSDDYEAMRTVIRRRINHLDDVSFGNRPDLFLVDGGVGQVHAVQQILRECGLSIPVAGMVKDNRHRTRGLVTASGQTIELRSRLQKGNQLFLRVKDEEAETIPTPVDSSYESTLCLLRLLTAIQNEAHRFAGQYRSRLHKKRQKRFALESISGVGPARRRLLLNHFKTIKKISMAGLDELKAVEGLPESVALAVFDHFNKPEQEP